MQNRGGARRNAGRKPKAPVLVKKALAEQILSDEDEVRLWQGLLQTEDEKTLLSALVYLCNRKHGLPPQSIAVRDETPQSKPLTADYIASVKIALGITGVLVPIRSKPEPTLALPRPRALPD